MDRIDSYEGGIFTFDKWALMVLIMIIGLSCIAEPVCAQGFGSYGPGYCQVGNAAQAYCIQHGGCPSGGNCYFPDGSYCDLWSFFNGTCPGRAYYEQLIWAQEAYNFLNGGEGYYPPSGYPPYSANSPYYSNSPYYTNYNSPGTGPYWSDSLNPMGW